MIAPKVVKRISNALESKTAYQVVLPAILLASAFSYGVYSFNENNILTNSQSQFEKDATQVASHINNEIHRYQELLYSTNAFLSSVDRFDQSLLKSYISQLDIDNYPAFYAINYIQPIEHKDLELSYTEMYMKYTYEDKHVKKKIGEAIWKNFDKIQKRKFAPNHKHYVMTFFEPTTKGVQYIGQAFGNEQRMLKTLQDNEYSKKSIYEPRYIVGQLANGETTWVAFSRLASYVSPTNTQRFKGSIGLGIKLDQSLFGKVNEHLKYVQFQIVDEATEGPHVIYDSRFTKKLANAAWPDYLEKEKLNSKFMTVMPINLMNRHIKVVLFTKEYPPHMESLTVAKLKGMLIFIGSYLIFFLIFHRWFILSSDKNRAYDVAEKITEELRLLAYTDTLTKLPNRRVFVENLNQFIEEHPGKDAYLFFLDLDGFKKINDTLGHNTGDLVLQEFASRLRNLSTDNSVNCYRIGGDEFTILIDNSEESYSQEDIKKMAQRVLTLTSEAFNIGIEKFKLSSSIGIAHYPLDGSTTEELFQNSDLAMYHIKHQGKNNFSFYSEFVGKQIKEKQQIETLLSTALDNNEFYLVFQPKTLRIDTGFKSIGAEVLLRWKNDKLGEVTPNNFIPIAEETGLMNQIGHWVFEESVKKIAQWNAQGIKDMRLAINLSVIQFANPNMVTDFISILEKYEVSASQIILEITESVVTNDIHSFKSMLKQFSNYGFKISMDDFGTGYSSLYFLRRLEINEVKIDRTFTKNILENATDCIVLEALINLAHQLDLTIVIEGVENKEQLDWFKDKGKLQLQGFYFSKPLKEVDFLKYWTNEN